VAAFLSGRFANPAAVTERLRARAAAEGSAREDVASRRGQLRVSVHRIAKAGYVWRLDELAAPEQREEQAEVALPAMVASRGGSILSMNEPMRRLVGSRAKTLDRVFRDKAIVSGRPHWIETADGPVRAVVCEMPMGQDRRRIHVLPGTAEAEVPADADTWPFFEDVPVPLLRVAPGGVIEMSNRMSRDLLADEIAPGTRVMDLVEGLGRSVPDWIEDAFGGRGLGMSEMLRARRAASDVFLQITLERVMTGDGPRLVAVLIDATELKTLEAQFVQSQKMQAIGQLAGGVAHDFNNLLTAISGHCDLLMLRHDQGDPDYGDLVQINQNANRAASLVGQLLAFSRKQNLQFETIDLRDTLSELIHLLNRLVGEKVTLRLIHEKSLHHIRGDKRQLEQVLMNLVVNARDALPEGGEIRIETQNCHLEETLVRDRAEVPAGDYVLLRVIDEGTGIAPDKLIKIFEPFFTTKRPGEGTGLGLSTAYGIVKQSGGFIFADSTPGVGTTFTLMLPAQVQPVGVAPVVAAPAQQAAPVAAGEGVVLLVEDEAPVRAFASRALRLRGYTVVEAESAEDALELLRDDDLHIDLFVTDVIMPGMDGPTWVREALRKRPETKVVFVSGYAEDAFDDPEGAVPNSVFLPKPFSLADLAATVQRQMS
jgi:two-component system cell cycle sensor histidine kinase/response regulator CckA